MPPNYLKLAQVYLKIKTIPKNRNKYADRHSGERTWTFLF